MPLKKGYKKRRGKKAPYKKYRKGRRKYTMKVSRGLGFIAPRLITRMKYTEDFTIQTLPTITTDYLFRLNSLFDPNKTGTGHQPYGFDQLANLYLRYRVFATKWVIQVAPPNDVSHFCVIPVNGLVSYTVFTAATEQPKAMVKSTTIGSVPIYFKGKSYLPRLGGDKRAEYKSDDRFSAIVTANPTEVMDLHLLQYNPSSTVTLTSRVFVTILYMTEFFDPLAQAQS